MTDKELKKLKDDLWHSADMLRASAHLAANKYGQPILGLIFLRYADILFKQHKVEIVAEYQRKIGTRSEKTMKEISIEKCGFYLPECAYFDYINNASDDADDRPGMKAVQELNVCSPLRECGITKAEVRKLSKEAGLFTWDKPAYACLATRIPTGETITADKLSATEKSETALSELGFTDFRIRMSGTDAKIQVKEDQLEKLLLYRKEILKKLKPYYSTVTVDLEVRS